jgi:hypothetical protein
MRESTFCLQQLGGYRELHSWTKWKPSISPIFIRQARTQDRAIPSMCESSKIRTGCRFAASKNDNRNTTPCLELEPFREWNCLLQTFTFRKARFITGGLLTPHLPQPDSLCGWNLVCHIERTATERVWGQWIKCTMSNSIIYTLHQIVYY